MTDNGICTDMGKVVYKPHENLTPSTMDAAPDDDFRRLYEAEVQAHLQTKAELADLHTRQTNQYDELMETISFLRLRLTWMLSNK